MIKRYEAIATIMAHVGADDVVLSTTGMISREVFMTHDRPGNFYMLGSMGLLSAFGLGLALLLPEQRVVILEGDGSALMSLGTLPLIAVERPANLVHIILDNEAYESTGAQPSISAHVDLAQVAQSCGYKQATRVEDKATLEQALQSYMAAAGPSLLLVKVAIAPVEGIARVAHTPTDISTRFRQHIRRSDGHNALARTGDNVHQLRQEHTTHGSPTGYSS